MAKVVAANWVPEPQMWPGMIDALDEAQGIQTQKLTTEQRQVKLFEKLDLSGLGSWSLELVESACLLLDEYHNIFSLEPCELDCTHSTKHVIKVTDDAPFRCPTQVDSSAIGGRSPCTTVRDVGSWCDLPQPECMV